MDALLQDLRFAWRSLRNNLLFTATAVITLALGIGVNTAVFSVVNAALFQRLPFANADRLMTVSLVMPADPRRPGTTDMVWSYPKYEAFRKIQSVFDEVALSFRTAVYVADENTAVRATGELATASYFKVLGVRTSLGHTFSTAEDSLPDARRVVVLGQRLWRQTFGGDPSIVGRTITLNNRPYTVVGVAQPGFRGISGVADLWIPVHAQPAAAFSAPWSHQYTMVALLKPNLTGQQANAAMPGLGRAIDALYPNPHQAGAQPLPWSARAQLMNDSRTNPQLRRVLYLLWIAVGCVLLIAAANVAGMQLARASARTREVALRVALGASRGRVVRQLLTESLVLTAAGTALGLVLGELVLDLVFVSQPDGAAQLALASAGFSSVLLSGIHLDLTAVVVSIAVALAVGIAFGLIPATHTSRADLGTSMRGDSSTWATGARAVRVRGRELLVVGEVGLAFALIVAATLLGRSVQRLMSIDPGFNPRGLLTARISLPAAAVNADSLPSFTDELLARVSALPGVASAALADCPPLSGGCSATFPSYLDRADPPGGLPLVGAHWVTPSYFATLGVSLKRGRFFTSVDRVGSPHVVVVNESMAKLLWPGEDPIGKHLRVNPWGYNEGAEVIGVVGDTRFGAIDSVARPDSYASLSQSPRGGLVLLVRSPQPASVLISSVRSAVAAVAPRLPLYDIHTMEERVDISLARPRFAAQMLALFGILALILAGVGVYGLIAFVVARRTREIGIRIALGAESRRVVDMVLRRGFALVFGGIAVGIVLSAGVTRLIAALLYKAPSLDVAAYLVATGMFVVVAGLASFVPARRAATVDPVITFRVE